VPPSPIDLQLLGACFLHSALWARRPAWRDLVLFAPSKWCRPSPGAAHRLHPAARPRRRAARQAGPRALAAPGSSGRSRLGALLAGIISARFAPETFGGAPTPSSTPSTTRAAVCGGAVLSSRAWSRSSLGTGGSAGAKAHHDDRGQHRLGGRALSARERARNAASSWWPAPRQAWRRLRTPLGAALPRSRCCTATTSVRCPWCPPSSPAWWPTRFHLVLRRDTCSPTPLRTPRARAPAALRADGHRGLAGGRPPLRARSTVVQRYAKRCPFLLSSPRWAVLALGLSPPRCWCWWILTWAPRTRPRHSRRRLRLRAGGHHRRQLVPEGWRGVELLLLLGSMKSWAPRSPWAPRSARRTSALAWSSRHLRRRLRRTAGLLLHDPRIDRRFGPGGHGHLLWRPAHVPIASLVMTCELPAATTCWCP